MYRLIEGHESMCVCACVEEKEDTALYYEEDECVVQLCRRQKCAYSD